MPDTPSHSAWDDDDSELKFRSSDFSWEINTPYLSRSNDGTERSISSVWRMERNREKRHNDQKRLAFAVLLFRFLE